MTFAEQLMGCSLVAPRRIADGRGEFSKVLSSAVRAELHYDFSVKEIFWNRSHRGVIRGMHFLLSDARAAKVMWVSHGRIKSVVLDLRRSSLTFGQYTEFLLESDAGLLIIPTGCANGFESLTDNTIVHLAQEQDFDSSKEAGVRWNSFGCSWVTSKPLISDRDSSLPSFDEFESPFL